VDSFFIVIIFIPKLLLILILNSFLLSSDSLVFSEFFHSFPTRRSSDLSTPLDSQGRSPPLPLCLLLAQERDEARIVPDVIEIVIAHKQRPARALDGATTSAPLRLHDRCAPRAGATSSPTCRDRGSLGSSK